MCDIRRCGEEIERPYQYTPARDVWDVALLCIQCLWGRDVLERFDSLRRILDEGGASLARRLYNADAFLSPEDDAPSQDILDFLRSMLARQSSRRVDAGNAEILLSEASCDEARRSVPINFGETSFPGLFLRAFYTLDCIKFISSFSCRADHACGKQLLPALSYDDKVLVVVLPGPGSSSCTIPVS